MQASLHLIGVQPEDGARKHTVFVDSAAEARAFKPEEYFGTPAELLGRAHNRPREGQLLDASVPEASGPVASRRLKRAEKYGDGGRGRGGGDLAGAGTGGGPWILECLPGSPPPGGERCSPPCAREGGSRCCFFVWYVTVSG
jgi:hypothetical protein